MLVFARLLRSYLSQFVVTPGFDEHDMRRWFLPTENVVTSYPFDNPMTHEATNSYSFYTLSSFILGPQDYPTFKSNLFLPRCLDKDSLASAGERCTYPYKASGLWHFQCTGCLAWMGSFIHLPSSQGSSRPSAHHLPHRFHLCMAISYPSHAHSQHHSQALLHPHTHCRPLYPSRYPAKPISSHLGMAMHGHIVPIPCMPHACIYSSHQHRNSRDC